MKLQKYLSTSGVCSRRKAEEYIVKGLIRVNDEIAHIGQVIDPEKDVVTMSDSVIEAQSELVYYIFNKPRDVVTTCLSGQADEKGILDIVDIPERVFPIGRLDKETAGLIILTNDGRLSNFLMHPRYKHEKEYMVEVYGRIEDEALEKMSRGVIIDLKDNGTRKRRGLLGEMKRTYKTKPCVIERLSSSKFSITIREGKNRQIRRMVETVGYGIKKLKRIRVGNILLRNLGEGEYRRFTSHEKKELLENIETISLGISTS